MFHTLFYQPVLNLLVFLYNIVPGHDIGIAIILLTILVKLVLWPLSSKALRAQVSMQTLQPKLAEIKEKYKDNKEELNKAMMALYKTEKVNPFSSCLPLIIQLPFFWAIFRVFRNELVNKHLDSIYFFIHNPGALNPLAFGLFDLSKPNVIFAILAGLAQFAQAKIIPKPTKMASKDGSLGNIMNKQMMYIMPAFTVFICLSLPSGLSLYWFLTTLFTVFQQYFILHSHDNDNNNQNDKKIIAGEVVEK